jgi:molybdopterin/thiamine biosynthesis adenylyltransferase
MALSDEELERYARHIVLKEIGGPGQARLRQARVLVIGAGGLGAPLLMYLAAAGVGTLGVVDDDEVSLSNLQRQIVHDTASVGLAKTASAAASLARINPGVSVVEHPYRITAENAMDLITAYDIVADGSDNFATRYLVSDACFLARRTLVSAAVAQFDAQISTFKPHLEGPDGRPYPSYRCLNPEAPPPGLLPACEEAGVIGALTGVMGSMQAIEVIKELLGVGESLAGRVLIYDALAARFHAVKISWDPQNPLNGTNPTIGDLSGHKAP